MRLYPQKHDVIYVEYFKQNYKRECTIFIKARNHLWWEYEAQKE